MPPQVELYGDFDPGSLLRFLTTAPSVPLEAAYAACEARGLTREAVYCLGRMGAGARALRLILGELRDMEQVLSLVGREHDGLLGSVEVYREGAEADSQAGRGGGGGYPCLLSYLAASIRALCHTRLARCSLPCDLIPGASEHPHAEELVIWNFDPPAPRGIPHAGG